MDKVTTKRIFVTGGGTGGHIYPALAVIEELRKNGYDDIFYVGNPKNQEYSLAKENNIKFLPVNVNGMPRKMSIASIFWAIKLVFAILKCIIYSLKYKPDVVFGTGGYVSAPMLFAARFKKIPYFQHDADAQPGVVTLSLMDKAIVLSTPFESVKEAYPNVNVQVTGNPIRSEFSEISKDEAKQKLNISKTTVLIMGGSQGARSVNNAIIPIAKKLIEDFDICILHQSGKKRYDEVVNLLKEYFPDYNETQNYKLFPYIDDMPTILKASDIAIARSGSLSLSEIQASGVASILIPYPYSASNHQQKNAQTLVNQGSAQIIIDFDLTPEILYDKLSEILKDKEKLIQMQNKALEYAKPDAVKQITKNIIDFLNG